MDARRLGRVLLGALAGGALVLLAAPLFVGPGFALGLGCLACKKWLLGLLGAGVGSGAAGSAAAGSGPGGPGPGRGGRGASPGGAGPDNAPGGSNGKPPKAPDDGLLQDMAIDAGVEVGTEVLTRSPGNPVGPLGGTVVGTITALMGGVEAANKGVAAIKSTGGRGYGGASKGAKQSMDAAMKEILNR